MKDHISILPRHKLAMLSPATNVDTLKTQTPTALFSAQTYVGDADVKLMQKYDTDAAVVQYVLRSEDGSPFPYLVRIGQDSMLTNPPFKVVMKWIALDWDLPSKGVLWGDESKPESQEELKKFILAHPVLNKCAYFYFSKSGVRVLFQLKDEIVLENEAIVARWRQMYSSFVRSIDLRGMGGDIELKGRTSPYCLNRVPRYVEGSTDTTAYKVFKVGKLLEIELPALDTKKSSKSQKEAQSYAPLDKDKAKEALWNEPAIVMLRETKIKVSYNDWRGLGTNIAALLGDKDGLPVFQDISSWDPSYDAAAVEKSWPSIVSSAETHGPMTWQSFTTDITRAYAALQDSSSLAAHIRKAVAQGVVNPSTDNRQEVYALLIKKEKEVKGVTVETVVKNVPNLLTILTHDNRWKGLIRRNHLGKIDMIGDAPIEDEHVFEIRELIARIYTLDFSKDDVWDALRYIAKANEFHPVADYLNSLQWDGVDRTKDFAKALGQTEEFARTVLRRFLISAVVRPLEWDNYGPQVNWKIDTVLVLKGHQGKRKSTFFKALCEDDSWFSDNLPSIQTERKDASMHMLGKWIVEQAEFDGHVDRSSVENLKAFITREREIFRKPYGRAEIDMRRPSILVGTTNSESFLNDPTGDRRFWVLAIPDNCEIDYVWVRAHRQQLWAQAVADYQRGEPWWLTPEESVLNNRNNQSYRRPEPILEAVDNFLLKAPKLEILTSNPKYEDDLGFTNQTLVEDGLDKKMFDIKGALATKINAHLRLRGWERVRVRNSITGDRFYCYRKLKGFVSDDP